MELLPAVDQVGIGRHCQVLLSGEAFEAILVSPM